MGRRSINQRLDRALTPEAKAKTLLDWSKEWETETFEIIRNFERAIRSNDYDLLCITTGRLKEASKKRFTALPRVFIKLIDAMDRDNECQDLRNDNIPDRQQAAEVMPMPEGYITLREWSIKCGKSPKRGQKIMMEQPGIIPAARKVRNPRGGVPVWAVPEDTEWPY